MIRSTIQIALLALLIGCCLLPVLLSPPAARESVLADRQEVVFWHFWGGAERAVVDEVVQRFNEGQQTYVVSAVAMPGNNLDLKLFLSLAGGDPPDLVNIDDPVLADWAERGVILPLDKMVDTRQLRELERWLFPAARQLTSYNHRLYGLCNGLDVRALYYNKTALDRLQLAAPRTLADLDQIAEAFRRETARTAAPTDSLTRPTLGFLPNARNLWAWGVVFGGQFYDQPTGRVTLSSTPIAEALAWMADYGKRDGSLAISLRARDQSLPGKTFPLLTGRYACVVDGQWRARDIRRFQSQLGAALQPVIEFGVCALPSPGGQHPDAGWINGNYLVVPAAADNTAGAWEFMKYWSGFGGGEPQAAVICQQGGWIPVSQQVVDQPAFQAHLRQLPLFAEFVRLAASPHQVPRPVVPGAPRFDREVRQLAEQVMDPASDISVDELLQRAQRRLQKYLEDHRPRPPRKSVSYRSTALMSDKT